MTETSNSETSSFPETRWGPMVVLSVAFHLGIFLAIIFFPDSIPARNIPGVVYQVDLVELPPSGIPKKSVSSSKGVKLSSSTKQKTTESRRISSPQKKEKPLIVAKRTLDTKKIRPKVKRLSSTQLIDKAISKIEDRVKKEEQDKHVERAIQELEKKESNSDQEGSGGSGGSAIEGVSMSLYRADVKAYIRDNWSYPVALSDSAEPEAILLIKVENSGHIISYRFKKRSTDNTFNESVLKAIERSDPLPPFPETFRKREEEFEINFNLKDLQG